MLQQLIHLRVWQHTVPKPCTAEDLAKIQTWLDTKEVRTKDEVMLENFGYIDPNSANAAVRLLLDTNFVLGCFAGTAKTLLWEWDVCSAIVL